MNVRHTTVDVTVTLTSPTVQLDVTTALVHFIVTVAKDMYYVQTGRLVLSKV